MGKYIVRRLLQMIPVIIFSTFLIYAMVFAMPGDPTAGKCGERPCPAAYVAEFKEKYNLNDPLPIQYVKYAANVAQGDLGENQFGRPVADELAERFQVTAQLGLMALAFEGVLGIAAGVLAGLRKGGFIDNLVLVSTLFVISVPIFVTGFAAQFFLGLKFEFFPALASGNDPSLYSLVLPAMVLGSTSLAYIARLMRSNIADNIKSDYVRTAKAKGLSPRRIVGIHTLRNSMIPVITFLGADLGALMGGAIVTEGIFNVNGVGNTLYRAVLNGEAPVVVAIVTVLILIFCIANLVVDLLYAWLDPRIRYA